MSRARSELCVGVQTLPVSAGWTGAPGGEPGPVGAGHGLRVGVQTVPVSAGWTGAPGGEPGPVRAGSGRSRFVGCRLTFEMLSAGAGQGLLEKGGKQVVVGPTSNEHLFPVHRLSGLTRADWKWNFFSMIFEKSIFFLNFDSTS